MSFVHIWQVLGAIWGNRRVFVEEKQEAGPVLSWVVPDVASWADACPKGLDPYGTIPMLSCWLEEFR